MKTILRSTNYFKGFNFLYEWENEHLSTILGTSMTYNLLIDRQGAA